MLSLQLVIAQVIIVGGIVLAVRYFLVRNISRVTAHLDKLSQDYNRKEKEADKRLEEAKAQTEEMLSRAQEEAQGMKAQLLKEAQEEKDRILKETHLRSEQIVSQADKTREFLIREMNQKIEEAAVRKACELIQETIPEQLRRETHSYRLKELVDTDLEELNKLRLLDEIQEVHVTSAYRLTPDERSTLENSLRSKIGSDIRIKEEIDSGLIAGLVVGISSLVIDGSLRYTIQEAAKNVQHSAGE